MQEKQRAQDAQRTATGTRGLPDAEGGGVPNFDLTTWQAAVDAAGGLDNWIDDLKTRIADPAERARAYGRLSKSQIKQLPPEESELVWRELSRQLAEQPEMLSTLESIVERWKETKKQLATAGEGMKKAFESMLAGEGVDNNLQLWETLTPYMDAESDEKPEFYADAPLYELVAAAARRARADGLDIPILGAEQQPTGQPQEDLTTEADKEEKRRRRIGESLKHREIARQEGALDLAETHLAIIADATLGFDYFTSAVIKMLPKGIDKYILDEQGRINLYDLTGGNKDIRDVLQEVDKLHTAFLMWLLGLAWNNYDLRETNSGNAIMAIYLPRELQAMRIDPRPRERDQQTGELKQRDTDKSLAELRRDKFMGFIRPLLNTAAFFGDELYQIVGFHSYDPDSETLKIIAPYMFRLVEYAKLQATKHGAIKNEFHADVVTENQTAVEVANRIAMGVIRRGVTTPDAATYKNSKKRKPIKKKTTRTEADGTKIVEELTYAPEPEPMIEKKWTDAKGITNVVTGPLKSRKDTYSFTVRFSTIISDCPQLQREIAEIKTARGAEETKVLAAAKAAGKTATAKDIAEARKIDHKTDPQRVNKKLKDTFTAAIRIILNKSEMPKYYKNLTFRTEPFEYFKAPTNSTLNAILTVYHEGKDPTFSTGA